MLVAGGDTDGLTTTPAQACPGIRVRQREQSPELSETAASLPRGPCTFQAVDALGEPANGRSVDSGLEAVHHAINAYPVGQIPSADAFRQGFANRDLSSETP